MATPILAFAQLATECEAEGLSPKNGEKIAGELAKTFGVQPDEVGIMRVEKASLAFVFPAKLHNVGSIPMNTANSVAARTATSKRAEIINNFAQAKHASFFEAVELGAAAAKHIPGEKHAEKQQHVIQKLMSVPVMGATGAVGVVQICRKGVSAPAAGLDFTPADLQKLVSLVGALAKCFK
jgi:hypothetical protein